MHIPMLVAIYQGAEDKCDINCGTHTHINSSATHTRTHAHARTRTHAHTHTHTHTDEENPLLEYFLEQLKNKTGILLALITLDLYY